MKTPAFWYDGAGGLLAGLLSPLGCVYGMATARRLRRGSPVDIGVPVICVGNLTAGGAGKTPVVIDLARRLAAAGLSPHVVSRGYGAATGTEPRRVVPATDGADRVGDEPLMIARLVPVWVGGGRAEAARAAVAAGAGAVILDDGFQDPSVTKDLPLVVTDGRYGFGNGRLIPAGPLREPIAAGLDRAGAVVVLGEDTWGVARAAHDQGPPGLPVLSARIVPGPEIAELAKSRLFAFAGIGHPDKFFATLRDGGCTLAGTRAFADHHPFTPADLDALKQAAAARQARLVTTEKDLMRLPPDRRADIDVLTITLQWDDEAALDRLLRPLKP